MVGFNSLLMDFAEQMNAGIVVRGIRGVTDFEYEYQLTGMNRQLKELRERVIALDVLATESGTRLERLEAALDAGDYETFALAADQPRLSTLAADIAGAAPGSGARQAMENRFETAAQRVLVQTRTERDRALSQSGAVTSSIAELEQQLSTQTDDLVELRQLTREAEADRRIYEQFLRRLNETSVQQGVQQADARVLSPAVVNFNASYPPKMLAVLAAGFFGGLCGIAFVLIIEQMNNAFRSSEELEKNTGLAVLGNIPVAPVRMRRGVLDYAVERPSSALVEAIRNLRTGVLLANVDRQPKMIMLTSSLPKEGKTTCSLLLVRSHVHFRSKLGLMNAKIKHHSIKKSRKMATLAVQLLLEAAHACHDLTVGVELEAKRAAAQLAEAKAARARAGS